MAITKDKRISASILSAALLFLIVGGCLLTGDLLEYKEGVDSRKWLAIEGTVKTQSIHLLNRDGGANNFSLNATYIYHIDDQAYRGDRVAYPNELRFSTSQPEKTSDTAASKESDKSMFAKYAPEASVTVFYNPYDKKQSTLTRGASARRFLMTWLRDSLLIVIALGMFIFRFRKAKQPASVQ